MRGFLLVAGLFLGAFVLVLLIVAAVGVSNLVMDAAHGGPMLSNLERSYNHVVHGAPLPCEPAPANPCPCEHCDCPRHWTGHCVCDCSCKQGGACSCPAKSCCPCAPLRE